MKPRLLADTCSAIKLAVFDNKCFQKGKLTCGDVIIHPLVHKQIRTLSPEKKTRLNEELKVLSSIRAEPNLTQSGEVFAGIEETVRLVEDNLNIPIGFHDRRLIATALFHEDMSIVTNDRRTLAPVAASLEVTLFTAEEIVVEAFDDGVLSKEEILAGLKRWSAIKEEPTKEGSALLRTRGFVI